MYSRILAPVPLVAVGRPRKTGSSGRDRHPSLLGERFPDCSVPSCSAHSCVLAGRLCTPRASSAATGSPGVHAQAATWRSQRAQASTHRRHRKLPEGQLRPLPCVEFCSCFWSLDFGAATLLIEHHLMVSMRFSFVVLALVAFCSFVFVLLGLFLPLFLFRACFLTRRRWQRFVILLVCACGLCLFSVLCTAGHQQQQTKTKKTNIYIYTSMGVYIYIYILIYIYEYVCV